MAIGTPAWAQTALFTETWESGTARWRTADTNPVTVAGDSGAVCSTQFQRETIPFNGGRAFSTGTGMGVIPVVAGQPYCLSGWVRGSAGSAPFLGVTTDDGSGAAAGVQHWLVGSAGFDNGYGGTVVPVTTDAAWHWYKAPFTVEGGVTFMVIMDELWVGGAAGSADFDDITFWSGACPAAPAGVDAHATCGGAAPICSSSGACVAPPDMTMVTLDLALPPLIDMAAPRDLAAAADLAAPAGSDMAGVADLAVPTASDLATPADLRAATDLGARNDLASGGGNGGGCDCDLAGSGDGRANLAGSALGLALVAAVLLRRRLRRY